MQLFLVDTSSFVADALREAFEPHPEVTVEHENILAVAENTIVSPANSYGYMDGGIDELYVSAFGPELQKRVLDVIDRVAHGMLPVGSAVLVETGHARVPQLVVAPTMELPGPIEAAKVFFAMAAALRLTDRYPSVTKMYSPGLGTGTGRVPAAVAAREMEAAYSKWRATKDGGGSTRG